MSQANIWQPSIIASFSADSKQASQSFIANNEQNLFNITSFTYAVGTGSLTVYKNGLVLRPNVDWVEQTANSFSLVLPCISTDSITAIALVAVTGNVDVKETDIFFINYQAFRSYTGIETTAYARGKVVSGDGGEGFFTLVGSKAAGHYVDDNATVLIPTGGNGSSAWVNTEGSNIGASQEQLLGGGSNLFPIDVNSVVAENNTVPAGTTHLRVPISGNPEIVALSPASAGGEITLLTESGCSIGGVATGFSSINSRREFDSVQEMVSYRSHRLGDKYTVSDYYGGSNPSNSGVLFFTVVPSGTGSPDGGRYIDITSSTLQLKQNLKIQVDVKSFGARGDGVRDDSVAFHNAQSSIEVNQIVFIPISFYRVNLKNWTRGIKSNGATLRRFNLGSEIIELGAHFGVNTWYFTPIEGVTIDGEDKGHDGIIMKGSASNKHFSGRWVFNTVLFVQCNKAVNKGFGNIGNRFTNCTWTNNNYGVFAIPSATAVMHVGSDVYNQCHFDLSKLAAIYYQDGTDGVGQVVFNECIFEGNEGFGVFFRLSNNIVMISPFTLNNCWFEVNASSSVVTIEDLDNISPRDIRIDNANLVSIKGSYITNFEANKSIVNLEDCRIDESSGVFEIQSNNSLVVSNGSNHAGISSTNAIYYESVSSVQGGNVNGGFRVVCLTGFQKPLQHQGWCIPTRLAPLLLFHLVVIVQYQLPL